jgi:anaerobic selenocysteine-containing dehydrogenase
MDILKDGAEQLRAGGRGFVGDRRVSEFGDMNSFWNTALQHGFWRDDGPELPQQAPSPPPLPEFSESRPTGRKREGTFHLLPFASTSLTDGRGARLPWLQATPDPITTATWQTWVEVNHAVADEMGLKEGDVVRVENVADPRLTMEALVYPHPAISPDVVSIPVGQGHTAGGRYAEGRGSNVLSIISPETDESGALAWAATRVRLTKTGRWKRLPRFENVAPDRAEDEHQEVIKITPTDS